MKNFIAVLTIMSMALYLNGEEVDNNHAYIVDEKNAEYIESSEFVCGVTGVGIVPVTGTIACVGEVLEFSVNVVGTRPLDETFAWTTDGGGSFDDPSLQTVLFTATTDGSFELTLRYTNEDGCDLTTTQPITINPPVTAAVGNSITDVCLGQSLVLNGNPTGGSDNFSGGASMHTWTLVTGPPGVLSAAAILNSTTVQNPVLSTHSGAVEGQVYQLNYVASDDQGCTASTPASVFIEVRNVPVISGVGETLCSGDTTSIEITNDNDATTFTWIVTDFDGATGPMSGSGDFTTPGTSNVIAASFMNVTGSDSDVIIAVTPFNDQCEGSPINVTVTVQPEPVGFDDDDVTICSSDTLAYDLQENVNNTAEGGNAVVSDFSWMAAPDAGVTGASSSTGDMIDDVLINITNDVQTVVYTVTPTSEDDSCEGETFTITVTVQPEPIGFDDDVTTCSSVALAYDLQANVDSTAEGGNAVVSDFSWMAAPDAGVTGASSSTGDMIDDVLTNNSNVAQTVVYTVTPTSEDGSCEGCLLYTSPSPRDRTRFRMPSSA